LPTQDELRALWERGVPLDRAWLEFTPDNFDAFMLRVLETYPANDDMFKHASDEAVRKRYAELKGWLPMDPEGRQTKLRNKIAVQRSYLLDNLYKGDLWAIGVRTLPNGFDELARVPRHCFFTDYDGERDVQPKVYWAKGEVEFGGSSYFDIRVVVAQGADSASPTPADEPRSATTNASGKNRLGGRTRTSDEIGRTVLQLWDTQPAFRTLPLKLMVGEVRAAIHGPDSRDLELVNYKSSSMEKVIADALRARRDPKKRKKPKEP
jgi:hypothetical protein